VQGQSTKGRVVGVRKCIDQRVHRVSAHGVVVDSRSINELIVELSGKKWVGKLSEKLFQQTGSAIDVVLECFRIPEIDLGCVWTKSVFASRMSTIDKPLSNKAFICWMCEDVPGMR
jgi:hypothetical protein